MRKRHPLYLGIWTLSLVCGWAGYAFAQDTTSTSASTTTPPASTAQAADDSDTRPQPVEPDYRIVNLPTTLRLPRHGANFTLTHRFNGDLTEGSFLDQLSTLFGMDNGASIGLEYRYGVMKNLEAVVFRTNIDQAIQFTGKYDGWRQKADSLPLSVSPFVAVEGAINFRERYMTTVGASIGRNVNDRFMVYADPFWVMNSAAGTGEYRNTVVLGIGGRVRIKPRLFVVAEVSPRLGGYVVDEPEYGFGIETRVGGHVFQLNFTNANTHTTFGQLSRGGFLDSLYFGFNLSRKFF